MHIMLVMCTKCVYYVVNVIKQNMKNDCMFYFIHLINVTAGLVLSQKYWFIFLTEVIFPEYQCHFRYKGKFLFQTDIQHGNDIFFLVKKGLQKLILGTTINWKWDTTLTYWVLLSAKTILRTRDTFGYVI